MNAPRKVKIGILGATGRMGGSILRLLESDYIDRATVVARVGQHDSVEPLFNADVIIDFSLPEAFLKFSKVALLKESLPAIVTGTTGWTPQSWKEVEAVSKKTHLLFSSNFSIGVFFLTEILKTASSRFRRAGYEPVVIEQHHIHKLDSPSGTAKTICQAIAPDRPESVQVHAVRAGETVGDHEVTFYGPADRIVLGHYAQDRTIFARGAIEAALWINDHSLANPVSGKVLQMETFFNERYGD